MFSLVTKKKPLQACKWWWPQHGYFSVTVVLSGVDDIFSLEGEQRLYLFFFTSYRLWQDFIFLNRPLFSKHFLSLLSQTDMWMKSNQRGKCSIWRARLTSCISSPTVYTSTFFKFTSFQIRTPELNVCHYRKTPSVSSPSPSILGPGWLRGVTSSLTRVAPRLSICGINGVFSLPLSDLTAWHRLPGVPLCVKSPPSVCHATELNPQSRFVVLLQ